MFLFTFSLSYYLPALPIVPKRFVNLRATRMTSPDIRAGVALLIAAMSADGVSTIQNIDQIDRGYKDIDLRLNALGARIERVDECAVR